MIFLFSTYIFVYNRHIWSSHSSEAIPSGVSRFRRPSRTGRLWKNVSVWLTTYGSDLVWPLDAKKKIQSKFQWSEFALQRKHTLKISTTIAIDCNHVYAVALFLVFSCLLWLLFQCTAHSHTLCPVQRKNNGVQNSQSIGIKCSQLIMSLCSYCYWMCIEYMLVLCVCVGHVGRLSILLHL